MIAKSRPVEPILILSTPRSGSTLLRFLIDAHPDLCCPPELRLGVLCEALIAARELTLTGVADMSAEDRQRSYLRTVRPVIDDLMSDYCRTKGKSRWCEKSPVNLEYLEHLDAVFPDARWIVLYRHGLDTVQSMIQAYGADMRHALVAQALARYGGNVVAAWMEQWCRLTERLIAFETMHRERSVRIYYETLVTNTDAEMQRICDFLGVEPITDASDLAFLTRHDPGPGCNKIHDTSRVEQDRVGQGFTLSLEEVPEHVGERMYCLLERLKYA